jgi:general secretion pathway protein A
MYKKYFGLTHKPFSIAPDPHFLFMSDGHREALAHLLYGIEADSGFVLLTGEIGAGKTTICRCLLEQIHQTTKVAYITNTMLSVAELLATICDEFGIHYPAETTSFKVFVDRIKDFLIEAHANGDKAVLIIDEAQNLRTEVLEQLRLLTNLETNERKLLMIIMLGQPELREKLAAPELKQLRQRITARYHLQALSQNEVSAYVSHRLAVAGIRQQLFCKASLKKIYTLSGGIPRLINSICDRALLGAYSEGLARVDKKTLIKAAHEYFGHEQTRGHFFSPDRRLVFCSLVVFIGCIGLLYAYQHHKVLNFLAMQQPVSASVEASAPQEDFDPAENASAKAVESENTELRLPQARNNRAAAPIPGPQLAVAHLLTESEADKTIPLPEEPKSFPAVEPGHEQETISDSLSWPDNQPIRHSKTIAFQALFQQWDMPYDPKEDILACEQANSLGLACFYFQGNFGMLQKINRPAVLRMINDNGLEYYTALIDMSGAEAVLNLAGEQRKVSISTLEREWFGEGILLWKTPPEYQGAVKPGRSAPWLGWLEQQFAAMGWGVPVPPSTHLSGDLLAHARQLQSDSGFVPDGIVGPRTLIALNTLTDTSVPVLKRQ